MRIDRRSVVKGSAALVGTSLPRRSFGQSAKVRVGVVGGGIIGCSIAMHLAEAGAAVLLFEKAELASGATKNSLAWINPVVQNEHYMRLRLLSMKHWHMLDERLGTGVIWGGSVSWTKGDAKAAALRAKADLLRNTEDAPEMLADSNAVTAKSPAVSTNGDVSAAMFLAGDGHVDPVFATNRFAAAARRLGARLITSCEVTGVDTAQDRVVGVTTNQGKFALDQLVFVGGTDTPHLLSMVGHQLKLKNAPGLVVHTTPTRIVTRMAYEASGIFEFKQYANGQIVTSFTQGPPDLPQHAEIRAHQMNYPSPELKQWHGQMLIERTAPYLPAIADTKVDKILLGFRPLPTDGLPVVGPISSCKGCYVVVTHSGVTLAPIMGDFVTQEVLGSRSLSMLEPYRPERFQKS